MNLNVHYHSDGRRCGSILVRTRSRIVIACSAKLTLSRLISSRFPTYKFDAHPKRKRPQFADNGGGSALRHAHLARGCRLACWRLETILAPEAKLAPLRCEVRLHSGHAQRREGFSDRIPGAVRNGPRAGTGNAHGAGRHTAGSADVSLAGTAASVKRHVHVKERQRGYDEEASWC